ncbi:MAG: DUF5115 domain-containing protein [Bacteroidales bacterium]|jgi:hypothetical protein|nr:DUF5115 domain-containing protein [Bacteroidales bacterium]
MKKIYLYSILLFAGFSACTEDFTPEVVPPTSYPQEAPQVIEGFAFDFGNDFKSAITITENDKNLELIKATATPAMVEGATVVFKVEISDTENFAKSVELPAENANNTATIQSSELNEAVKELFGKAPLTRTVYLRSYVYIQDGTQKTLLPGDCLSGPVDITVYSNVVIEQAYYLFDVTNYNVDDLDSYKFEHSDKDVYEDPIFTLTIEVKDAFSFLIMPQSVKDAGAANPDAYWNNLLGNQIEGNTALEGTLIKTNDGEGPMSIGNEKSWAKITLNMLEYTYTIELFDAIRQLYVPGGHQGWDPPTAPIVYSPKLDMKFDGYVYMAAGNAFKFTSEPVSDWSGTNYGDGGNGTLSTAGDAANLTVAEAGFYRLTVDLSKVPYTYTATATEWGVAGEATTGTPEGWNASVPMTLNQATGEWTVTTTLFGGKEYKFRANNDWPINLGGNLNNLTYGGDNILAPEDGTYQITLKLGDARTYSCTVVKQ